MPLAWAPELAAAEFHFFAVVACGTEVLETSMATLLPGAAAAGKSELAFRGEYVLEALMPSLEITVSVYGEAIGGGTAAGTDTAAAAADEAQAGRKLGHRLGRLMQRRAGRGELAADRDSDFRLVGSVTLRGAEVMAQRCTLPLVGGDTSGFSLEGTLALDAVSEPAAGGLAPERASYVDRFDFDASPLPKWGRRWARLEPGCTVALWPRRGDAATAPPEAKVPCGAAGGSTVALGPAECPRPHSFDGPLPDAPPLRLACNSATDMAGWRADILAAAVDAAAWAPPRA